MTSPADESATAAAPTAGAPPAGEPLGNGRGDDRVPTDRRGRRQERAARTASFWRVALEWVVLVGAAVVVAFLLKAFVFEAFWIPSGSMLPTLHVQDRVLVNKLAYDAHAVHRGDIVVFLAPKGTENEQIKDLIKRVVGLPGETIEGRDGHILIDGRALAEPYLPAGTQSRTFGPVRVPADSYYVLGDNRLDSKDSTYFGPIGRHLLVGRAFLRFWPLSRISFLGPSLLVPLLLLVALVVALALLWKVLAGARTRRRGP